ncbi:hypothetical protein M885DRAFT_490234 [Pelagophyceae sp. CCMP2097]|nr:hypothetical protein M885DRAFT_490234 [Pelagophyceae sp. CCMP2097]
MASGARVAAAAAAAAAAVAVIAYLRRRRLTNVFVTVFSAGLLGPDAQNAFRDALDDGIDCAFVTSGNIADVDERTTVLVSSDDGPFSGASGRRQGARAGKFDRNSRSRIPTSAGVDSLAGLPHLEAFVIPYAGLPPAVLAALRREHERRAAKGLQELWVCNSHHNAPTTAELAVGLALCAAKRLHVADDELRRGDWRGRGMPLKGAPPGAVDAEALPQLTLDGRRAVIVGLGSVGERVAVALAALGMDVHATARSCAAQRLRTLRVGWASAEVTVHPAANLVAVLRGAALVVICVPLNPQTEKSFGEEQLGALAKDAVVVNVARGPVVDEAVLFIALQSDSVASYASDVWWKYPLNYTEASKTFPWTCCDLAAMPKGRSVLSAHRGGAMSLGSTEALRFGGLVAAVNALRRTGSQQEFATTSPLGRVNLAHGY